MITALTKPLLTADDLLAMPDSVNFELVDGQLVERNVSTLSSLVEGLFFAKIWYFCNHHKLGHVWPSSMGYQCFLEDARKVRKPDVSFVKAERFSSELLQTGYLPIPPDLAVEVISPNDLASEIFEKIEEYLDAGVPLIWIADPETRVVNIYRKDGSVARLRERDELRGDDVLPNFRCPISELFPTK